MPATIETMLYEFLDGQVRAAADLPELALFTDLLRTMIAAGGKRIRPVLCLVGWQAASDLAPPPAVWRVAASLELFHLFALIHDDIMDASPTRRGKPTAHHRLATHHAGRPDADTLGTNAAILLGDLALGWSYELLHTSHPSPTTEHASRAWPLLNALRTETLVGQYLDLLASGPTPTTLPTVSAACRVIRYKTTKYTCERPLHLGAHLAGAGPDVLAALSAYALPLGEAFQLRDDLLGVYGAPERTGKSVMDDFREGKQTVLAATALARATPAQAHTLHAGLGNPYLTCAEAARMRQIITDTGAQATVENLITERYEQALAVLDHAPLRPPAVAFLRTMAAAVATRTS
ncbi:polyprenyl synthetase family protein [Streptomyces subrutilus]|uniref:polyprenyl synthetase family protein n=1 Tax=Streptomyces subrutilus TaxID=36818 RepID=UPI001E564EBF|nr:polyprenyl synthetase family protein [Streptomyces subrutilus]